MSDDLAVELAKYAPPDIPLRLTATGSGSRPDIVEYVRMVIEQRTTVNDDTTADRLARALVTSILSRLGAGYSIATGSATIALVPVPESQLRRRRVVTRELAKEVAVIYRGAHAEGQPPTVAVAEHFKVSHRTASRWVAQARDLGELGPAAGTKPGEAE